MPSAKVAGPPRVFLNVPFDADFQPLFLALIAGVVVLGGQPTCALQVADAGRGRLHRILDLIEGCELSIHDLSRIQISRGTRVPRFNMPFELGICCAIARINGRHDFYVFEEKSYRLQRSLSDLGGYDPQVHGGTQLGVARSLLNCMAANARAPRPEQITALARKLGVAARKLANRSGARSIYEPHIFRQIAASAAELSREAGLID